MSTCIVLNLDHTFLNIVSDRKALENDGKR